jgi:hypothetical protein
LGDVLDAAGNALLVQAPDRLQLGPGGGHVDGDERGAILPRGGLAAMQDEVALQRAGRHAGPLAPRAQRDLGPVGREGASEVPRLPRAVAAQGTQQPIERGRAGGGECRVHRGSHAEAMVRHQRGEQRREQGAQQLSGQLIARQPDPLEDRNQLPRRVPTGAAGRAPRGVGRGPQPPDGGLTMTPGRAAVLVEQSSTPSLVGLHIPGAHHRGIFPTPSLGHGASLPVCSVTPVLRHRLHFR